ncbi:dihydrofolate reductase [Salinisphaera sp. LB1]|uniref:dihydrofolate reductase n=1 Tax=Salinisphaera sp. LB1 TaxID=2183911 RepID=UPI000D707284|nr:dihydrofolate reductase [Salinisphaera sp. LB1]AWN17790.1 Dihydrofolate reductase [Salinisphaera sp. LB1]
MTQPRISLIAAMDVNGVIGARGGMPWHLPEDLRWFKHNTRGKPIVMGRRTFESIGRALPHRRNLVLTRQPGFRAAGVVVVDRLDAALAQAGDATELMVIGGAQVYALALPQADRLLITRIEAEYAGDTWFPAVDWAHWRLVAEEPRAATDDTPAYRFMTYARIAG